MDVTDSKRSQGPILQYCSLLRQDGRQWSDLQSTCFQIRRALAGNSQWSTLDCNFPIPQTLRRHIGICDVSSVVEGIRESASTSENTERRCSTKYAYPRSSEPPGTPAPPYDSSKCLGIYEGLSGHGRKRRQPTCAPGDIESEERFLEDPLAHEVLPPW